MFYTDVCNFYQRTVSRKLRDFLMFSIDKDFHGLLSNRIVQRSVAYEEKEIYEHQISNFLKSISFLETVLYSENVRLGNIKHAFSHHTVNGL